MVIKIIGYHYKNIRLDFILQSIDNNYKIRCNIIKCILYTSIIKNVIILKYLVKLKYLSSNPNIAPLRKMSAGAYDCSSLFLATYYKTIWKIIDAILILYAKTIL